jgi:hypothetical protein
MPTVEYSIDELIKSTPAASSFVVSALAQPRISQFRKEITAFYSLPDLARKMHTILRRQEVGQTKTEETRPWQRKR